MTALEESLNDKFEANTAAAEVEGLAKAPASEEATAAHLRTALAEAAEKHKQEVTTVPRSHPHVS